jgi:C4-dicarboxylate transporter, DctM subunit
MLTVSFGILILFIALSLPVAAVLGNLGLILDQIYSPMPLAKAIGMVLWSTGTEYTLVAIPLFILLGEILLRSGIATGMYDSMRQWLSWLPGGLMHSNIGACALFAATSGSSVATAATIGTVAIPEIRKNGYNERLFLGTLAAGGTLGILIPPSINMIIFGVLTDTSIPKLYLAAFVPGLIMAFLFMVTVIIACIFRPGWGGRPTKTSWEGRRSTLKDLLPPLGIFIVVIGSIYSGLATPTESAALGVVAALVLAGARRRLSVAMLRGCCEGTMRTSAMVVLIILAAYFLNFVISAIGLTEKINEFVTSMGLSPFETMVAIIAFYLVIGCFMETLSMMITTVTIVTPVVVAAGYDAVWFGVMMMLLVEMAQVTPPIGINLYVIQGVRGGGPLNDVIIGTVPFFITLLAMIALLLAFPQLALWIPANVQL